MMKLLRNVVLPLSLGLPLGACSEQPQEPVAPLPDSSSTIAPQDTAAPAIPPTPVTPPTESANVETGMFFRPGLNEFALHNESDEDGDGDGVKETHVRRYINKAGDTAFSMTTGERLWAWSLDTKAGDGSNVRENYVVRDSNCDNVFDERYSLNAEFHVPACVTKEETAEP